jgi:peptidyl-prolyl cis-trans isomerase C
MKRLMQLAGLVLIAGVFAGCSSEPAEDAIVAKVGPREIPLATFEKAWATVDPKYLPGHEDLAGRTEFLETIINKEILGLKADQLGYDKDEYVVQGMEAFKQVGLQAGYLKVKVADKIEMTEAKLQEAFKHYGKTLQMRQILCDTEDDALQVVELIKGGGDFETVCKQHSKGPDAAEGGRMVGALWGTFPPQFQVLFETEVGDITPPIFSKYGYFVIKVISANKGSAKTFEEARPDLEKLLLQQLQMQASIDLSDNIREKHNFEFYEQNIATVFDAIPADRPLTNPPNRSDEIYPLLRFDPQDLDKPLCTYAGKSITIKDFSDLYDRASFFQRPRREYRYGDVRKFLIDIVMNELVEVEMETSGIEKEPEVAEMLARKQEQLMVDKLYQDLVDGQTDVSRNELEEYYTDNIEQFRRPEERRFNAVVAGDRESAEKARKQLIAGRDFETVKAEFSMPDAEVTANLNDRWFAREQLPEVDEHGYTLDNVGDVSATFEVSNGWAVIKLVERKPERILPLGEAQHDVRHALKTIRNEERLNELLAKWREEFPVEIDEKLLMKAKLSRGKRGVDFS